MKKMTILKSIATLVFLVLVGMNLSAQVITGLPTVKSIASDTSSLADTVTIGAVMPYFVHPDAAIKKSSLYNQSGFQWTISGAGATLNTGSLTPIAIGGTGTFYKDTLVNATFANTGNVTISTFERSNPKFSATAGCEGNPRNLAINVINKPLLPTIANTDTAQGGCTPSASYTINFDFSSSTSKFPVYVSYTIRAYDLNNNLLATSPLQYYSITDASKKMVLVKATEIDAVTSASGVRYTVTLGQLWDRISSNGDATNRTNLAVDASSLKAAILVLPTPQTGIIKHIKTL